MDGVEFLPVEIADALGQGAIVVTGNERAARALRRGWDQRNRAVGLASWAPAAARSWDSWTAALWRELVIAGNATQMLLNRTQEHAVWRTILEADEELASLRSVDSLAEMAVEAWQLLSNYEGQRRLRGTAGGADTRAFQRWARSFEQVCRTEGFLAQAQLEERLREALNSAAKNELMMFPAGGVVLVGFDGMTPAQMMLVEALRSAGVAVEELQPVVAADRRMLVEAADEREELFAAARWVRSFLEEQPDAKIAVIVPRLEKERSEIDRVFREVLAPELQNIRTASETGPFEFSLGVPLAETPMVATALDLLRWAVEALPLERVSGLLLSPYFAPYFTLPNEERGARAEFDAFELRTARMLRPEISLEGLVTAAERSKRRGKLSRLRGVLRAMRLVANRLQGMDARTNAEWTEKMRELLEAAAWGSDSSESSVEFQTRLKWEGALDELTTLDFDGERVEFVQALEALERIARQTTFAPESRDAPVQVMGPLEAAGGTFDAMWFLRGGELSWPMEVSSNSLLLWSLQRDLQMPGTDVARDTEYAKRMTERIASSAGTVVFSYAKESAEGRQRPSPVLIGLGLEDVSATELVGAAVERKVVEIEEIEDVARVQAPPNRVIRGGARILELQAACGFRAFAEQRLRATEVESIEPGMDARESGTVVHEVLKLFWDAVRTQDELKSMTIEERDGVLEWCIGEALKRTEETSATAWDVAYLQVQRDRLRRLLNWWLELEMERGLPFEVKLSEKEFKDVSVGPLRLSVRMDRVDAVVDEGKGGEVLIDYKTGDATPNDWLTERPDAPQLPLYAILSEGNRLRGVAFGLVRAGEGRGLKGYAVGSGVLPGRPAALKEAATLEAQVERWRQVLVGLAEEFYAGDARVNPKQYPKTCEYCGQRLLCRLDVSSLEDNDEDDTGASEDEIRG
jgi:ATP-dependent helicase/nuclease subunit B